MAMTISTVNGYVEASALGRTLMHEHLVIGFPGWESDTGVPAPDFRNMVAACVDRVQELQDGGFASLVDPCPNDVGRNVDLMGEVAARTGFNIIFATGLYNEHHGGSPYWGGVFSIDPDGVKRLCDMFVGEIENGVRGSGAKPGILKFGTTKPTISAYEKKVIQAAAMASQATGVPITTHTEGVLGDDQVDLLAEHGVSGKRVIVGHCCGSDDHDYHMRIIDKGAFIGFDRFGIEHPLTDEVRIQSILKIREKRALDRVIISHDSVCCWLGAMLPPAMIEAINTKSHPMRFSRVIAPMLIENGVTPDELDMMLIDNPRRYFAG
jgi:phosphotriesterase-related protein